MILPPEHLRPSPQTVCVPQWGGEGGGCYWHQWAEVRGLLTLPQLAQVGRIRQPAVFLHIATGGRGGDQCARSAALVWVALLMAGTDLDGGLGPALPTRAFALINCRPPQACSLLPPRDEEYRSFFCCIQSPSRFPSPRALTGCSLVETRVSQPQHC